MLSRIIPMLLLVNVLMLTKVAFGQTNLEGFVKNSETNEPMAFISIKLENNYTQLETNSDANGLFNFSNLTPGNYQLIGYNMGSFDTVIVTVKANVINEVTFLFNETAINPLGKDIVTIRVPENYLRLKRFGPTEIQQDSESFKESGAKTIDEALNIPVVRTNQGISFRGSRPSATQYYVDDMRLIGTPTVSLNGVDYIKVYNGGLPAKYGDTTGGLVVIETKSFMSNY